MARMLRREPNCSVLGLVPLDPNVGALAAALQLGVAVQHLTERNVTVLDCNTPAPAWAPRGSSEKEIDDEIRPGIFVAGRTRPTPDVDFSWCESVIAERLHLGHFVICDLTGLAEKGILGRFFAHLNGIVSIVRSGASLEWRLTALHKQFPKHLDRGVLILDE